MEKGWDGGDRRDKEAMRKKSAARDETFNVTSFMLPAAPLRRDQHKSEQSEVGLLYPEGTEGVRAGRTRVGNRSGHSETPRCCSM